MKKILVLVQGKNGVELHRNILPYLEVQKLIEPEDEIDLRVGLGRVESEEDLVERVLGYDILIYSTTLPDNVLDKLKGKVKLVCDIDDWPDLHRDHPLFKMYKQNGISQKIFSHIKRSDYITTTSKYLADKIKAYNSSVYIFPNALKEEDQFIPSHKDHSRVNIIVAGSSSHVDDMKVLKDVVKELPPDILDKVQFRLCGFDKAVTRYYDDEGKFVKEVINSPDKNPWYEFESYLTNDYKTISKEHMDFLMLGDLRYEYKNPNEPYMRLISKPISSYAEFYNDADILLVPLKANEFNKCKSILKVIEAGVKEVAVIASDVLPYSDVPDSCILKVRNDTRKWVKGIVKLVRDQEYRNSLIQNNKEYVTKNFNLTEIAKNRLEFLKGL